MAEFDPISLHDRLLAAKPAGMSRHAWTRGAGVNHNFFTDVRKNGRADPETLERMLSHIGLTEAEFEAGVRQTEKEAPPASVRAPRMIFQGQSRPRDVPVVGTAECADLSFATDDGDAAIEMMGLDPTEIVDHVRRPVSLDNRRDVYAIHFTGVSMEPRYEPGEVAYVDPRRAPTAQDYVVVQLRRPDLDGERVYIAMAKRLVRRTAHYLELEQFNPPLRFRVDRSEVAHLHRIIPWPELVGF